MLLLIKYTLLYGIVLMLVALGGMFSEHSGVINIALEGIMVIGGVAGVLTLTMLPADLSPFLTVLISVLVAALAGVVYSLLLAFASINLKADQTIGGTALNLSKNADFAQSLIPDFGLNKLFQTNSTTIAIFLAAAVAVLIWVVLNKTTFGYELKAVGLNKNAARYAGINEKKNIILSMAIAGALAGFGAGLYYLSNVSQWNPLNSTSLPTMGFNGISVALLASSNPIGTVFSALFISHISVGGSFLSTKYYPTEIADLISGIIIYLCAFSMLFRGKIQKLLFKNADKTNVNAEPAPAEKANAKKEGK